MRLSNIHEAVLVSASYPSGKIDLLNKQQGYDRSQSTPEAIRRRSERNKARRKMVKAGKASKGDGKHINHKKPLSKGGTNSSKNLEVSDAKTNWAEGRRISAANQRKKKKS